MQALLSQQVNRFAFCQQKQARRSIQVHAERPYGMWYPNAEAPAWLDGSMPGDFGFDPFGIGSDTERLPWFQQSEIIHGRWAMVAVTGILAAEIFNADSGALGNRWFEVGGKSYDIPLLPHLATELVFFAAVENLRLQYYKQGKNTLFDPLDLSEKMEMQVREVKHGRLAMITFVAYWVQSVITLEGPLAGLKLHMDDPLGYNITTNVPHISDNVLKYYPDQPMLKIYENYDKFTGQ